MTKESVPPFDRHDHAIERALTPGPGLAHFVIDYGPESHLLWVVFLDEGGTRWTAPNPEIRIQNNWSLRRREKVAMA